MAPTVPVAEATVAAELRDKIAPTLASAVQSAMHDQPSDVAGYFAQFLASAGAGGAQRVLDARTFSQECAKLEAELASLKEQLRVARGERARRSVTPSDTEAQRNAALAAAARSETRRLKRLTRSMKIKIGEPLSASDWPISEGVLLVQGGPGMGGGALCGQLKDDFDVSFVDNTAPHTGDMASHDCLGNVLERMAERPSEPVLVHQYLDAARAREQLIMCTKRVGLPTAVLLLHCSEAEHAKRVAVASVEAGEGGLTSEASMAAAMQWTSDLVTLEAAAREASVPVIRVDVSGGFDQQMSQLLVACTSI